MRTENAPTRAGTELGPAGALSAGTGAARTTVRPREEDALKYRFLAVLAAMTLVVSACTGGGSSPSAEESMGAESMAPESMAAAEWPDELVIGFVPSSEAGQLVEDIQPLADYLSQQLGIPVTGIVSTDYTGLVTAMETGQAQIAALPPYGLVQAVDRADAEVILQSERFGSGTYHTQFFTNNPDKYCTVSAPEENTRVIDDADVTFLNCNGTARAQRRDARGSDRPRGALGTRGRDGCLIRRADLGLGLHLPGHGAPQRGHRSGDGYRSALRRQPRRVGHRRLRWGCRDRRELRRCPHDRDERVRHPRHGRRVRLRR